jgi:hypothetical protein
MSGMYPRCSVSLQLFSISGYARGIGGGAPVGPKLLRDCLMQIHKDVIRCWNFEGNVIEYRTFQVIPSRLTSSSLGSRK